MRRGLHKLLVCALGAATASGALAFSFIGVRWSQPTVTIRVGMSGTSPSGIAWSTAMMDAMKQWNDKTDFTFVADPTYANPCSNTVGVYGADFGANSCGSSFGAGTLAVTFSNSGRVPFGFGFGTYEHTSIVFNSAHSWDIYDGTRRNGVIDFRRVALHELGHVIGLDHETANPAIMQPTIGNLYTLQADDIAAVDALYNAGSTGSCLIRDVSANAMRSESLATGDCRVRDLFGNDDTSFVDVYRLRLAKTTTLDFAMSSSALDSVLILADTRYDVIGIYDDTNGQCDARFRRTLPPGEYRLLANTYVAPSKCAGNTGDYSLTISDSGMPALGSIRNALGAGTIANAVISGGATADGTTYAPSFSASQPIDVLGRIVPDPQHVGLPGNIYVLAVLGDGRQFVRDRNGNFVRFGGGVGNLVPMRSGTLAAVENVAIASGLQGSAWSLAGQTIFVYVGYSLASSPTQVWYGGTPIVFSIGDQ